MGEDSNDLGPLEKVRSLFSGGDEPDAAPVIDPVVEKPEPVAEKPTREDGPQSVGVIRHHRQKFAGLDGEYVYRNPILIRGKEGLRRRVEVGETVDIAGDIVTLRRLRSLWYAKRIELKKGPGSPSLRPRNKYAFEANVTNNRIKWDADKAEEEQALLEARGKLHAKQALARRRRTEEDLRKRAEQAVLAAEQREEKEFQQLLDEERREAQAERAAEEYAANREQELSDAAEAVEVAKEKAEEDAIAAEERAEQAAADEEKAKAHRALHLKGKETRAKERHEADRKNTTTNSDGPKKPKNVTQVRLTAKEHEERWEKKVDAVKAAKAASREAAEDDE